MNISQILSQKEVTFSLEVFPPKQWDHLTQSIQTIEKLFSFAPDFISVTYGAGGTTSGFTIEIAKDIAAHGFVPLSHFTCVGSRKETIDTVLAEMEAAGVHNILALRGDLPKDGTVPQSAFRYASELTAYIKSKGTFCVGGACYPEKHPESKEVTSDILHLKEKVDAGADFLTTQMFFDNDIFFRFRDKCAAAGIDVPLITGIMPITAVNQIGRSVSLSGCSIPKKFADMAAKYASCPEDMKQAGIEYAVAQIRALIEHDQKHIHIYTMNKPETTALVYDAIKDLL